MRPQPAMETDLTTDPDPKKPLHIINNRENAEVKKIPEFRRDIKSIITYFNDLDRLLEQHEPDGIPLYALLNKKFTGIRAIECLFGQVTSEEFKFLSQQITQLETKMKQSLEERKKERKNGQIIDDFTVIWLERKGPDILHSVLRNLEKKVK